MNVKDEIGFDDGERGGRRGRVDDGAGPDTIFAPASGAGVAGIGVIRISGPAAESALHRLSAQPVPPYRRAAVRRLRDEAGVLLDEALVLRFPSGGSYTGEPVVELHCHGGRAVIKAVLSALAKLPGFRLAEPGEFTRRALLAGRMDLPAVEALGDLIAAETELQRRQALRGLSGALGRQADRWRRALLRAAALIEATLDWADEEVPEEIAPEARELVDEVHRGIVRELALSEGARQLREGFEVAIVGRPNAGKSSLFNMLAGREAAIVSPRPGTTRDVLELRYDLAGLPVVFLDTAGLRASGDELEAEGVARAERRAAAAAVRLFLRAHDAPPSEAEERLRQPGDLTVWNKTDVMPGTGDVMISSRTGVGIDALLERLADELGGRVASGLAGHLRQRRALEEAAAALDLAGAKLDEGEGELAAEELRHAFHALDRLLGRVDVEDVLDRIFGRFCIGK